jgi:hypothetical protein
MYIEGNEDNLISVLHETAKDLNEAGLMDDDTLAEFAALDQPKPDIKQRSKQGQKVQTGSGLVFCLLRNDALVFR